VAGAAQGNATTARVEAALGGIEGGIGHAWLASRDGIPALSLAATRLKQALRGLKERAGFESITLITAVDRLGREPRFELLHQLWSLQHGDRVRLHSAVGEGESAPSCIDLWPGAAFMERECYDMFGIVFAGHSDLKRLLMPEGYGHHPLRKDFPHHGIEPDRLYREWDRRRRAGWRAEAP
jgi:NADH-quinone oxidoreductase subunit C